MYNIIIWGAGKTAQKALKHISDDVNIIGFLDNDPYKQEFEGLKALDTGQIHTYQYDLIVICSIYHEQILKQLNEMRIPEEKVLVYNQKDPQYYHIYQIDPFKTKWKKLMEKGIPDIFISGISYQNDGIADYVFKHEINKCAFNFALRGQDLFYDYHIAKFLDRNGYLKKTTHYIVGMCYYSFELDLSRTGNAWEIIRYYPYINEPHNLMEKDKFPDFVKVAEEYLKKNRMHYIIFNKWESYPLTEDAGKVAAKQDFHKGYPITVWENKRILKQFLAFLNSREIKPVIVIMPAMKGYVRGCPIEFKERFYMNLNECIEDRNIQVLDYFGNYYGEMSDYYHVSHFNKSGAEKFTRKLIRDIEW